ncbi:MAG TPA: VWA domain-containing protein [Bacteroidota bacterium]|jgi:Ca-activated chloride channel family protein|nr:VWA domain-containing protein [Bacteroidota bacterium]
MKTLYFLALMLFTGALQSATPAMSLFPKPPGEIVLHGSLNQTCIPRNGGIVYLHMQIETRDFPLPERADRPMNIAVVLDRSGSMGDERKMEYARQAVCALVDRLSPTDYLSIVIYDDHIETLLPTQHVKDRSRIKRLIEGVYPRGSTNLGGGMQEGFRQITEKFKREYINRVILVSDGLANQGITDPYELNRIAGEYRNRSISLTTMGVGLDYNENLMLGLAEHGGGNYYFIESPHQLASIFERELNGLSCVIAQNASIELTLGRGVTLNDAIGCDRRREGDRWLIPVGDIYTNDHREFTAELSIPEGSGTRHVASGFLKFDGGGKYRCTGFSVDIRYSDVTAEVERSRDWDTQGKVDIAVSTKRVQRAMEALDAGREEDAAKELNEAKQMLESSSALTNSPASAPAMQEQIGQLEKYSRDMKDGTADKRRVKKSMQYNNYRTQKKIE